MAFQEVTMEDLTFCLPSNSLQFVPGPPEMEGSSAGVRTAP